ncbi:MAG TPA: lysozyme [Paludibacter sp.]|nr:lysozyme [Paludibacter sp.]
MKTSDKGIALIIKHEKCRLSAYQDSAGNWTIGYGHKGGVRKGQVITKQKANDFLRKDLASVENAINAKKYRLTQGQFDALVSLFYNLGTGAIKKYGFHPLLKQNPNSEVVPAKIKRYVYSGGSVQGGLVIRRSEEVQLYNS